METSAKAPEKADETLDPTRVFAVIPALNEARHIEPCIRSLMASDTWAQRVMLIVVDGGSTDDTVGIVQRLTHEFPNLRILHNPKRLQSAAINLAVRKYATHGMKYFIRCDAHSVFPAGFLQDVTSALARTGAASIVVPMDAKGETCFERANAWIVDTPLGSGGSAHRGGTRSGYVDHGHHAGFDIALFRSIGGYDETFSHNEDAEYDQRVLQAGGQIYLDATIRKAYVPRGTMLKLARQYYNYGKGRARTVLKHRLRPKIRQLLPVFAFLGSLAGLIASPFYLPTLVLPIGYISILVAASIIMCIAKRSLCGLLSGPASGTMHMCWAAGFIKQCLIGPK